MTLTVAALPPRVCRLSACTYTALSDRELTLRKLTTLSVMFSCVIGDDIREVSNLLTVKCSLRFGRYGCDFSADAIPARKKTAAVAMDAARSLQCPL